MGAADCSRFEPQWRIDRNASERRSACSEEASDRARAASKRFGERHVRGPSSTRSSSVPALDRLHSRWRPLLSTSERSHCPRHCRRNAHRLLLSRTCAWTHCLPRRLSTASAPPWRPSLPSATPSLPSRLLAGWGISSAPRCWMTSGSKSGAFSCLLLTRQILFFTAWAAMVTCIELLTGRSVSVNNALFGTLGGLLRFVRRAARQASSFAQLRRVSADLLGLRALCRGPQVLQHDPARHAQRPSLLCSLR